MSRKNFSRKQDIDAYLRNLDNNGYKSSDFKRDVFESDFVPDLGDTGKQYKTQLKLNGEKIAADKRRNYFIELKENSKICQLCGFKPENHLSLVIDHEHLSKKIRGVLCQNCNHGLGKFRDNPELMRKAADWVENFEPSKAVHYYLTKGLE